MWRNFMQLKVEAAESEGAQSKKRGASEEQLRAFIRYSPFAIAMFDNQMVYLAHSERWLTSFRLKDKILLGRSHYEVFPNIPEHWKDVHRRCLKGGIESSSNDLLTFSDGSFSRLRWDVRPWRYVDGRIGGIIISAEDITSWVQVDENNLYRTLSYSVLKKKTLKEKFVLSFIISSVGLALSGIIYIVNHDHYSGILIFTSLLTTLVSGIYFSTPFLLISVLISDYFFLPVVAGDISLKLLPAHFISPVFLGGLQNIIVHYLCRAFFKEFHARRETLKSKMELQQILSAIENSAIVEITDPAGKIIYANQTFSKISGYSLDEVIGQDHRLVSSGTHSKNFFADLWKTINMGRVWNGDIRNKTKNGETYWVRTVISPLKDINGSIEKFLSICFDITEQKNAETKLLNTMKMASLGEMAAGIAHEVNNPLSIIRGKVNQANKRLESIETQDKSEIENIKNDLLKIDESSMRISKIIEGLRAFARAGDSEPMYKAQLVKIIDNASELCLERFRKAGITLNVKFTENIEIECREVQISQVVMNLLLNAYDAVLPLAEKWIQVDVTSGNGLVFISFTDSGKGIDPVIVDKMMQPFYTTKDVGKGVGLGLSISKGIAEDHHGDLRFDYSSSNTRFVLVLPIRQVKKQSTVDSNFGSSSSSSSSAHLHTDEANKSIPQRSARGGRTAA